PPAPGPAAAAAPSDRRRGGAAACRVGWAPKPAGVDPTPDGPVSLPLPQRLRRTRERAAGERAAAPAGGPLAPGQPGGELHPVGATRLCPHPRLQAELLLRRLPAPGDRVAPRVGRHGRRLGGPGGRRADQSGPDRRPSRVEEATMEPVQTKLPLEPAYTHGGEPLTTCRSCGG